MEVPEHCDLLRKASLKCGTYFEGRSKNGMACQIKKYTF
jgi:hypothetical protein